MKERPILFSAPMVNSILNGTKTQTRRELKTTIVGTFQSGTVLYDCGSLGQWVLDNKFSRMGISQICPYGQVGDHLWVRETWAKTNVMGSDMFVYFTSDNRTDFGGPWKPSIHMPRKASRITLQITNIRVERLQDISEEDSIAEGLETRYPDADFIKKYPNLNNNALCVKNYLSGEWTQALSFTPQRAYQSLWEKINGSESWAANPFCWVIEFEVIKP